jgi:hypothetical protein
VHTEREHDADDTDDDGDDEQHTDDGPADAREQALLAVFAPHVLRQLLSVERFGRRQRAARRS